MNVRCAGVHGLRDDLVDQADDRRLARAVMQAREIGLGLGLGVEVAGGGPGGPFAAAKRRLDLSGNADRAHDRLAQAQADCAGQVIVERIGHAEDQPLGRFLQRNRLVFAEEFEAQEIDEPRLVGH